MKIIITERQYGLLGGLLNEEPQSDGRYDLVFVGGLEKDKGLSSQTNLLNRGLGGKNIKSFSHAASTSSVLEFMKQNPKLPVYLFSAGCKKAADLSASPYVNKYKLYLIEPYLASKITMDIVKQAISNGVPTSNVFSGPHAGRGLGINGSTKTPKNYDHFGALTFAAAETSR
jgi:hypothetical protein